MQPSNRELWDQSLTALASRQGAIEITRMAGQSSEDIDTTYRARLLQFDPNQGFLRIEQVEEVSLSSNNLVKVIIQAGPGRCQGMCVVRKPVKLNVNQTSVLADELAAPKTIEPVQRRSFFRVAAAGSHLPPVTIAPDEPGAWSTKMTLVNLSAGGMGVSIRATPELAKTLPRNRVFNCKVTLPGLQEPLALVGRLVHFKVMPKEVLYLGLKFEFPRKAEQYEIQETIVKFITTEQRKQLQRQRGTG